MRDRSRILFCTMVSGLRTYLRIASMYDEFNLMLWYKAKVMKAKAIDLLILFN